MREGEVLRDSRLNLHLHLIVHVSLGLAAAAVDDDHIHKDEGDDDSDNQTSADLTVFDVGPQHDALLVQSLETSVRDDREPGADRIEDTEGLNLAAISLLVDND